MPSVKIMRRAAVALLALAGCSKSQADRQADAIAKGGAARSDQIKQSAEAQARSLDLQSQSLDREAQRTGGYTGQRLKVQSHALSREADIVKKQGRDQADATREAANAQAKVIHSR